MPFEVVSREGPNPGYNSAMTASSVFFADNQIIHIPVLYFPHKKTEKVR